MRLFQATGLAVPFLACALLTGCPAGGGGFTGDGMTGGGMQAVFTAGDPSPMPLTLSMAPGVAGTETFQVRVLVTDINEFFGAAFRVVFDESTARFDGFSTAGSFIEGAGVDTDFGAVPDAADAGVILVYATRQGPLPSAGVDAVGSLLLITLNFTATGVTAGNAFTFDTAATRLATTCPTPPAACTDLPDDDLTWSGGTLTSN